MSTFDGWIPEFPLIRIDHFRRLPSRPAPLAAFLSHVHSDHLVGLESLKSPFVYCSPATRELVLRLEKRPHRINFQKGILEARTQTYKHLESLLKPLPLDTPVQIELRLGTFVQVTLLDANHCAGAVMFLIESDRSAILYTGDVRAEVHWVNSLTRHPAIVPYAHGLRRLDSLYLDTTFAVSSGPYRTFPPKADGLAELLRKLRFYPPATIFYFNAWTFGYEDVFLLLSRALGSSIHLDDYRFSLYSSLGCSTAPGLECKEAALFSGVKIANKHHPGIFTRDPSVRLHSCERGSPCPVFSDGHTVVDITPILSRYNGADMHELGIGGGKGDLDLHHELDLSNRASVEQLLTLCRRTIKDTNVLAAIESLLTEYKTHSLFLPENTNAIPLDQLVERIASLATSAPLTPRSITFPYSRHSSYVELMHLTEALQPRDVHPCTAPPSEQWTEERSMASLFGDVIPDGVWAHDAGMRAARENMGVSQASTVVNSQRTEPKSPTAYETSPSPRSETKRRLKRWQRAYDAAVHGTWAKDVELSCVARERVRESEEMG